MPSKVLDAQGQAPFSPAVFKHINPNVEDEPPIGTGGIIQVRGSFFSFLAIVGVLVAIILLDSYNRYLNSFSVE